MAADLRMAGGRYRRLMQVARRSSRVVVVTTASGSGWAGPAGGGLALE